VTLGEGKQLFPDGARADLKLTDTRSTSTGVVVLTYQAAP
jgi:dihydrofolate reductase